MRNLRRRQAQEPKHARLLDDVTPVARRPELDKLLKQPPPHGQDPPAHGDQVLRPLRPDLGGGQHGLGDAGAVQRRRADGGALRVLEDALDGGGGLAGRVDKGHGADALAVEAHVLGEGGADGGLEAQLVDKVADGPGVLVDAARVEAQVGRVEDRVQAAGAHGVGDAGPALAGRVAPRRVVRAGVEDDGGVGLGGVQGCDQGVLVQGPGGVVVVGEPLDLEAHGLEEELVVGPGGRGQVDRLDACVGLAQGHSRQEEGACPGEGLDAGELWTGVSGVVLVIKWSVRVE